MCCFHAFVGLARLILHLLQRIVEHPHPTRSPRSDEVELAKYPRLSNELWLEVFSYLSYCDMKRVTAVCRLFHQLEQVSSALGVRSVEAADRRRALTVPCIRFAAIQEPDQSCTAITHLDSGGAPHLHRAPAAPARDFGQLSSTATEPMGRLRPSSDPRSGFPSSHNGVRAVHLRSSGDDAAAVSPPGERATSDGASNVGDDEAVP